MKLQEAYKLGFLFVYMENVITIGEKEKIIYVMIYSEIENTRLIYKYKNNENQLCMVKIV